MKFAKIILIICLVLLFCGCSDEAKEITSQNDGFVSNYSDVSIVSDVSSLQHNKGDRIVYPEGLPDSKIISIDEAEIAVERLIESDVAFFKCERVEFIEQKAYYLISRNENQPDRVVRTGWYAVDIFNGNVYKYNIGNFTLETIR